jgi:death-on-curing protein
LTETLRYLTLSELIYINGRILGNAKIMTGKQKVRDVDLLDAAVARPAASAFGADAYPTLHDKAAALLHSVARNHPFTDGNKRTAAIGALFMLEVNGACVTWDREEALAQIVEAAEGRLDWETLGAWLPTHPCPPTPEADAERDMQIIDRLIEEHRWLLDALETR